MSLPPKGPQTIGDLLAVMAALRAPETGCPWDLQQTFASIAPYTIEEACEVADAIARGDLVDLEEELGDLLLQVVYHARIAEEQGVFDFSDVVGGITTKMIRRHPHVFGTAEERAKGAQPGFWERLKADEKAAKAARRAASAGPEHKAGNDGTPVAGEPMARALADVPVALPALTRAVKLQAKAARVGFDWPDLRPVLDKVHEELQELQEAVDGGTRDEQEAEFGDLLFVMANVARHLKIDPEAALRRANQKFTRRFERIEDRLAELGRTPQDSNLEEMDKLWDEVKREEHAGKSEARGHRAQGT